MSIRIKNWHAYQHYKERCPPWIKLHRTLLDDKQFHDISGDAARFLILLWLLASEDKSQTGTLPSVVDIAFRLRMTEKSVKSLLAVVNEWLISDASDVLVDSKQQTMLETEEEAEAKSEGEAEKAAKEDSFLPIRLRIGSWFGRRESTPWSDKEMKALRSLGCPPPEIELVESYYRHEFPSNEDYRRRDIQTLLNNWLGEIDRANRWKTAIPPVNRFERPKIVSRLGGSIK